jgi:hypothetical protein
MIPEVEVLRHLDDMMFLLWVLRNRVGITDQDNEVSHVPIGVDYPES